MENQLRCVMFNREEFLIEHQLDADVLFLLEGLYQYGVRVLNLDGKTTKEDMEEKLLQAGYRTEETLLIAAEDATLQNGREIGLATIAFVNQKKNGQTYSAADIVVEGFEEVDFYFLERIYQRKHGIPCMALHASFLATFVYVCNMHCIFCLWHIVSTFSANA